MIINKIGTRNGSYKKHEYRLYQPYDYRTEGLMNKVLPSHIINTTNESTSALISFMEKMWIFILDYVDELRYFKDPFFSKRIK